VTCQIPLVASKADFMVNLVLVPWVTKVLDVKSVFQIFGLLQVLDAQARLPQLLEVSSTGFKV
jgi:hypothetical protein